MYDMINWQFFWGAAFKCYVYVQLRLSLAEFHFVLVSGLRVTVQTSVDGGWGGCVGELQMSATITITTSYQGETGNSCLEWWYIHMSPVAFCCSKLSRFSNVPALSLSAAGDNFHVEMMHDGLNRLASASAAAKWLANCAKTVASSNSLAY